MKNILLVASVVLFGSTAFAVDTEVSTLHLGLRLSSGAQRVLSKYAKSVGKNHKLHASSVDIDSIFVDGEDLQSVAVTFSVRDNNVKDPKADGAYLHARRV